MLSAFLCAFSAPLWAHVIYAERTPSFQGEVGFGVAGGQSASPVFQMKGIRSDGAWDFSLGYLNLYGATADGLKSDGANLPTIQFEAYRVLAVMEDGAEISVGGGLGYTVPNLAGGVSETADNGISWTVGGILTKPINRRCSLAFGVKGFFFDTDSHLTTYGSHEEVLSTGQTVDVLDVAHRDDNLHFDSVLFTVALRWE